MSILHLVLPFLGALLKSQRQLAIENLALRQQVAMLWQSVTRPIAKRQLRRVYLSFLPRGCSPFCLESGKWSARDIFGVFFKGAVGTFLR